MFSGCEGGREVRRYSHSEGWLSINHLQVQMSNVLLMKITESREKLSAAVSDQFLTNLLTGTKIVQQSNSMYAGGGGEEEAREEI